jgi:hypothetical protein
LILENLKKSIDFIEFPFELRLGFAFRHSSGWLGWLAVWLGWAGWPGLSWLDGLAWAAWSWLGWLGWLGWLSVVVGLGCQAAWVAAGWAVSGWLGCL